MFYTVGEIAKMLEVAPSTLRYYDREGILPFVERSGGGIRMFKEEDFEWLLIIDCLKKTGMPLKDIKHFIELVGQGDETIEERLKLFEAQREVVEAQIAELQGTLEILDYKCWYYETAKATKSTALPREMSLEEIPEKFRPVRRKLKRFHGN